MDALEVNTEGVVGCLGYSVVATGGKEYSGSWEGQEGSTYDFLRLSVVFNVLFFFFFFPISFCCLLVISND